MANYQIIFNGTTIGAGTNYVIQNIDGLGGTAPLRIQDDNRGYIDGSYSGRDFYDERTVSIDMLILGDGSHTAQYYYKQLQAAFYPQQTGYYVDPTGGTPSSNQLKLFQFQLNTDTGLKRMYGRFRGFTTNVDPEFTYGYILTRAEFVFPDPRYYDDTATTVTGTSISLTNAGWATSCPVITVASASTSGTISDGTTSMVFTGIGTGNSLTVDLLSRVVYVNSAPTRNVLAASSTGWISIPALSSATWTSTVGSMSVPYRNAYV